MKFIQILKFIYFESFHPNQQQVKTLPATNNNFIHYKPVALPVTKENKA